MVHYGKIPLRSSTFKFDHNTHFTNRYAANGRNKNHRRKIANIFFDEIDENSN